MPFLSSNSPDPQFYCRGREHEYHGPILPEGRHVWACSMCGKKTVYDVKRADLVSNDSSKMHERYEIVKDGGTPECQSDHM